MPPIAASYIWRLGRTFCSGSPNHAGRRNSPPSFAWSSMSQLSNSSNEFVKSTRQ